MRTKLPIQSSFLAIAAVSAMALSSAASATTPSKIVAFGDSLSDNGNVLARFGGAVPAAPYYQGRFSNGPVAVEVMAQTLGLGLEDLAYGGAKTGLDNHITTGGFLNGTGVKSQVNNYVAAHTGSVDASALYVVWAGANDFFDAFTAATVATATQNLLQDVAALYGAGARQFFIPTLPDLQYTADAIAAGGAQQTGAHLLSVAFNGTLTSAMGNLQSTLPGAQIQVFDVNPVLTSIRGNYANVSNPCWTGSYQGFNQPGTLCANPAGNYLWDSVHPSASVHLAVGKAFAAAVPEPESYALVLVGLLTVAAVRGPRHRKPGLSIQA